MTEVSASTEQIVDHRARLLDRFRSVRRLSERIVEPLHPEDCVIQSMPDVSPMRWHLAHTTWFFETFVLKTFPGFTPHNSQFEFLFNSYYNSVGEQFPRARRGLLSRPTMAEVMEYRAALDQSMISLLMSDADVSNEHLRTIELGLHHEQQHQELMLTDIKHVLAQNPLNPAYSPAGRSPDEATSDAAWVSFDEGVYAIGVSDDAFAFDNETPSHRVFLEAFALRSRPVIASEYLRFIEDGGYQRPELWLSLGWSTVQTEGWAAPLYWTQQDGKWLEFTLNGLVELDHSRPVCHVSYFEADAYARWAGARLPVEAEWEVAAADLPVSGNFADFHFDRELCVHPGEAVADSLPLERMFGDVWEWTSSSYAPYPGYHPPAGAIGEYNGKFMCNQYVLRGGSCATPGNHIRRTYRNFFPPDARWQFSGIRLATEFIS